MMNQVIRLYLQQKETFIKKFVPVLKRTKLFSGIGEEVLESDENHHVVNITRR